jgi:hypothetical protein
MIILRQEERDLRWATVKRRLRLNTPRDPKTGETRRKLWLWVIRFLVGGWSWSSYWLVLRGASRLSTTCR